MKKLLTFFSFASIGAIIFLAPRTVVLAQEEGTLSGIWRKVQTIELADLLWSEASWSKIEGITLVSKAVEVYNLTVGNPHNFLANGILAHNKDYSLFVRIVDQNNEAWGYKDSGCWPGWPATSLWSSAIHISTKDAAGNELYDDSADGRCWSPSIGFLEGEEEDCWRQQLGCVTDCTYFAAPVISGALAAHDPIGNIHGKAAFSGTVPSGVESFVTVTPPLDYYCSSVEAWAGGDASWHAGPLTDTCTINVPGSTGSQLVVAKIAPCAVPGVSSVTNQAACLLGNTARTWAVDFSGFVAPCGAFNLQVAKSWEVGLINDTVAVSAGSYNYTATIPNLNSATDAHLICFRAERGGSVSGWVCDTFGTDITAPGCDFTMHDDLVGACGGFPVTQTNSNTIDLKYIGTNTGCATVSQAKVSLVSGGGVYGAYAQCFANNFDISTASGNFPIYARFRDSLNRESAQCSENLTHPIPAPSSTTIVVWDDVNGDGVKDAGEPPNMLLGQITSVRTRKLPGVLWSDWGQVNTVTVKGLAGETYEVEVMFNNICPNNYAVPTGLYDSVVGRVGTKQFVIPVAGNFLYLGGW
ncbi:MAG: hypothetical protein ABH814_01905, partial [bacterium]